MNGCILRGTSCDYYLELHQTKLDWATNRINEDRRERDELTKRVDELNDLVVELTTRLNQGKSKIQSIERACSVRALDICSETYRIQSSVGNQSTLSTNHSCTPPHEAPSLNQGGHVQPSHVQREGGTPPLAPPPFLLSPCGRPLAPRCPRAQWTGVSVIRRSS